MAMFGPPSEGEGEGEGNVGGDVGGDVELADSMVAALSVFEAVERKSCIHVNAWYCSYLCEC